LFGLDLGQAHDYSALAVAEQTAGERRTFAVRHLHRWPLGTSYVGIIGDLDRLVRRAAAPVVLVLDATGCGRPVVDVVRAARLGVMRLAPVVITGGQTVSCAGGWWHVPKRHLAGAVASCLEGRRLRVATSLKLAPVLSAELSAFKVRLTEGGHEAFGAWREKDHDDLVLAVALAVWFGGHAQGR
jgi:hypothetical protein